MEKKKKKPFRNNLARTCTEFEYTYFFFFVHLHCRLCRWFVLFYPCLRILSAFSIFFFFFISYVFLVHFDSWYPHITHTQKLTSTYFPNWRYPGNMPKSYPHNFFFLGVFACVYSIVHWWQLYESFPKKFHGSSFCFFSSLELFKYIFYFSKVFSCSAVA